LKILATKLTQRLNKMNTVEQVGAERDEARAELERVIAERDEARAERDSLAKCLTEMRRERDALANRVTELAHTVQELEADLEYREEYESNIHERLREIERIVGSLLF
jgi:uncharacterized coiled-coil DUF342 family protein